MLIKMTMEKLVETLNRASEAYYNGRAIMSDSEYDKLEAQLQAMEKKMGIVLPNSPTCTVGAKAVDYLPKFTHPYPAKSLDKTKDIDEFCSKLEKGIVESGSTNNRVVVMYKEDGSTAQLYYKNGKLLRIVTRGNGEVGNVVSHNLKCIEGIPSEISIGGEVVVRGEVVMSYSEFERINEDLPDDQKYRNARNLASATLTILDTEESSKRHLTFKAFNLVKLLDSFEEENPKYAHSFNDRLNLLEEQNFSVVEHELVTISNLKKTMDSFTESVQSYPYPVDGLVVAIDNYAYTKDLPGTEHHPNILSGYAFKWQDETYETVLRDIEMSPSRTGLLNPVAIFDPVEIDGTIVKRASLHNISIIKKMRLRVGNRIAVSKANLIIPYVENNLDYDDSEDLTDEEVQDMVGYCPTCGAQAVVVTSDEGIESAYCVNQDCPEKMIGKFVNFCSRDCLDIRGMSEETIKKLVDLGIVKEYSDFFHLDKHPKIATIPGFGPTSWKNMCEAAENARTTDFVKFFTGMSITNIGKGQLKTLKNYLNANYKELAVLAEVDPEGYNLGMLLSALGRKNFDFSIIDGFGSKLSEDLLRWLHENFDEAKTWSPELNVYGLMNFTDAPVSTEETTSSNIAGKSFCITGKLITFKNRQELVDKIESLGGKWVDSVSKKTDYLINNDTASTSGKNKKAKELNIPIISEADFVKMIS